MFGSSSLGVARFTPTQQVFSLSKVNGATDYGENLPVQRWEWPKDTWLQQRLGYLRKSDAYFKAIAGRLRDDAKRLH